MKKVDYRKLVRDITSWIKKTVKSANAQGVVFGLSGGVDSSVLAILCKMAFPNNTLGVIMPCFSTPEDVKHAKMVAKKFDIETKVIHLEDVFLKMCKTLNIDYKSKELFVANIKPRLRMIVLYYFANKLNYLVAGAGNKSELLMGYFTKYGDSATDFLPLGDLLKTQIFQLAKYLGVPNVIISKPPSAGLWDGQTDESELGIKYSVLDEIITAIEQNRAKSLDKKLLAMVKERIKKTQHKRELPLMFNF